MDDLEDDFMRIFVSGAELPRQSVLPSMGSFFWTPFPARDLP